MTKKKTKKSEKQASSEQPVAPAEALKRMKSFAAERKEKFVAAIKKSQN